MKNNNKLWQFLAYFAAIAIVLGQGGSDLKADTSGERLAALLNGNGSALTNGAPPQGQL